MIRTVLSFRLRQMITTVTAFTLLAGAYIVTVPHCAWSASVESAPDMLERTLPAIVTVGIYKGSKVGSAYGFTAKSSDIAYEKSLDLGGAMESGSGFVIESKGKKYIVTNSHVIDSASDESGSVFVFSINRTKYPVRIVGADTFYDVAVLEFTDRQPGTDIGTVEFSSQEARIGEQVYAIGNPLGDFPYTVTQGIIGGKNRVRDGLTGKFGYLQSSATTIWGNSGGPLIDTGGRVIGINSQIEIAQRKSGMFVQPQLNFALEAPVARRVVADLIDKGRVVRAYLGLIVTQKYDSDKAGDETMLPRIAGAVPGSPAAAALVGREGYIINKINGIVVRNVEEALGELERLRPGAQVALELEENKERTQVSFATGELTQRQHGELATYFLRSFAGLDITRGTDEIVITPSTSCSDKGNSVPCRTRGTFNELDSKTDKYDELEGCHEDFHIRQGGVVRAVKEDKYILWKVRNPANIGLIIRLTALNGIVSFVGTVDDEKSIVTLSLSDDGDSVLRTLLY